MARLAHSFAARFLAASARTPADRQSASWLRIIQPVDRGVTADFAPVRLEGVEDAWSFFHLESENPNCTRVDYRTIGPADESGAYAQWLKAPIEE